MFSVEDPLGMVKIIMKIKVETIVVSYRVKNVTNI